MCKITQQWSCIDRCRFLVSAPSTLRTCSCLATQRNNLRRSIVLTICWLFSYLHYESTIFPPFPSFICLHVEGVCLWACNMNPKHSILLKSSSSSMDQDLGFGTLDLTCLLIKFCHRILAVLKRQRCSNAVGLFQRPCQLYIEIGLTSPVSISDR